VPVVPGTEGAVTVDNAVEWANKIGYPVIIKATSGGGGKGMKVATSDDEVVNAVRLAGVEAKANFGNDEVYMERYLRRPRHIEIQVVGDTHGNVANLGERDCSIQRRHQKVWEEAPSPALTSVQRTELGNIVNQAIKKMGYRGVGTLEFLFEDGEFFFMEMNTRIQVEHPVTEMVTGIDLVKEQIMVAAGHPLSFTQNDIKITGHAIECRINAEDPQTFVPSPGKITSYHTPGGFGVRVDSHMYDGYVVPPYYDSMIAKLIVHGKNREEAMQRVKRSLDEYVIDGIKTTIPLHRILVDNPDMRKGEYDIHWLEKYLSKDN
jgi:acetyl-CoA carboxylase biotin carboxylase subunit